MRSDIGQVAEPNPKAQLDKLAQHESRGPDPDPIECDVHDRVSPTHCHESPAKLLKPRVVKSDSYDVAPDDAAVIIRSVSREFPDYGKVIASAALAFEHWRYLHEYESLEVNPSFLSLFANAIAARACRVLSIDPAIPMPLVEQKGRTWWG